MAEELTAGKVEGEDFAGEVEDKDTAEDIAGEVEDKDTAEDIAGEVDDKNIAGEAEDEDITGEAVDKADEEEIERVVRNGHRRQNEPPAPISFRLAGKSEILSITHALTICPPTSIPLFN
jgi:hypothetical protein